MNGAERFFAVLTTVVRSARGDAVVRGDLAWPVSLMRESVGKRQQREYRLVVLQSLSNSSDNMAQGTTIHQPSLVTTKPSKSQIVVAIDGGYKDRANYAGKGFLFLDIA